LIIEEFLNVAMVAVSMTEAVIARKFTFTARHLLSFDKLEAPFPEPPLEFEAWKRPVYLRISNVLLYPAIRALH